VFASTTRVRYVDYGLGAGISNEGGTVLTRGRSSVTGNESSGNAGGISTEATLRCAVYPSSPTTPQTAVLRTIDVAGLE
jgi:hypothetical protein